MGASRRTREELAEEAHNLWLQELKDSGIPVDLVNTYGAPFFSYPIDDEDERPDEFTFWDGDDSASE
jgi:hypothetical protein